jgi:hypothetical protein
MKHRKEERDEAVLRHVNDRRERWRLNDQLEVQESKEKISQRRAKWKQSQEPL